MVDFDSRLGQLAIARGLVSLSDMMDAVADSARTGQSIPDVLLYNGLLSNGDIEGLQRALKDADLTTELETGSTIVLDALAERVPPGFALSHTLDIPVDLSLGDESRYEITGELGRGGMGRVYLAKDKTLQRKVALKRLIETRASDDDYERLMLEARITGLLEHPAIVPVYDLSSMRSGDPFYTMRVVQERNLMQLIEEMSRGVVHSLTSLVSVLRQVSLAVEFAHGLGVVHRDLKPENILVGKYGEVYVIDWGVAKVVSTAIGIESTGQTNFGQLIGTPAYMAPEQARGDNDAVNEQSDVYALGAILYEVLTLTTMFPADHVLAMLFQIVHQPPERPSERAPDRNIPRELEEICLRALQKDPRDRYKSAKEFADELELFLEGVKARNRERELAEDALMQARQVRSIFDEVRAQYATVLADLTAERDHIQPWAPPAEKQALWSLQQQVEDLEVEIERRFGEVIRMYGQALVHVPDMAEARRELADLYWDRFCENEAAGRLAQAAYFESLVLQYADDRYDELLDGVGTIALRTNPPGAAAELYRYQQVDRRLVEWKIAAIGPTPTEKIAISHGSYVVELSAPGFRSMNVPVKVERVAHLSLDVQMYRTDQVPDDYVIVAAGEFLSGKVTHGISPTTKTLPDYAIARVPVTVREYLVFLNALVASGRAADAALHAPTDGDNEYFARTADGRYYLPDHDPEGDHWQLDWPMFVVNYHDAVAYAEWLSSVSRFRYRLPTLDEWEKAARGVDGRIYPWGNHFDASFCCMRRSRPGRSLPASVGSFAIDRSPYGMQDACGNIVEWTSTVETGSEGVHYLGGASFNSFAEVCRLDLVLSSPVTYKFAHYGFRLAVSLNR